MKRVRYRKCRHCGAPLARAAPGRPRQYCGDSCRVMAYQRRDRPPRGGLGVLWSSRSDEWATEPEVFARLEEEFGAFTLDPCATPANAKCPAFFTREQDGLAQAWAGRVFLNPPFTRRGGGIAAWVRKAWEASQTTAELVVCLVPVRTGSAWWQDFVMRGEIRFLRGRLKFGGSQNSAPFDSAIVVFRKALALYETPPETSFELGA